jgi:predicted transcriptional regulator
MERNEISAHEVRFYLSLLKNGESWKTSRDLAKQSDIAYRTARAFSKKFADIGIVETAEVFPAHRYRIAPKADKTNHAYITRLNRAVDVFAS